MSVMLDHAPAVYLVILFAPKMKKRLKEDVVPLFMVQ